MLGRTDRCPAAAQPWFGKDRDVARVIVRVLLPILADNDTERERCLLRCSDMNAKGRQNMRASRRILWGAGGASLCTKLCAGKEQRRATDDDGNSNRLYGVRSFQETNEANVAGHGSNTGDGLTQDSRATVANTISRSRVAAIASVRFASASSEKRNSPRDWR